MNQFQIRNYLNTKTTVVQDSTNIEQAELLLHADHASDVYVVDAAETLLGVIPEYEFLKLRWMHRPRDLVVSALMSPVTVTFSLDESLEKVVTILCHHIHPKVPVVENRKLLGTLNRAVVLTALRELEGVPISAPAVVPSICNETISGPKYLRIGNYCRGEVQ